MAESSKRSPRKNQSRNRAMKRLAKIDPRKPWKQSWWILWGFITAVGELILIFLVRGQVVRLSTLQVAVIAICIPFLVHLLVSGVRTLLFVTSR